MVGDLGGGAERRESKGEKDNYRVSDHCFPQHGRERGGGGCDSPFCPPDTYRVMLKGGSRNDKTGSERRMP